MRRRALATIGVGAHAELLDVTRPTRRAWADRHGYDVVESTEDEAPGRPPSWGKVPFVRDLLARYEVVFWVDADAAIVADGGDPSDVLGRRQWLALVSHRYDGLVIPNFGVFVLRSTRGAKRLLDALWAAEEHLHHKWWENAALLELLGYDITDDRPRKVRPSRYDRRVAELDVAWNSIPHAHASTRPFVVHMAGSSQEDRLATLGAAVAGSPLVRSHGAG